MSQTPESASTWASGKPPQESVLLRSRRQRRMVEHLSVVLLLAAAVLMAVMAFPVALRLATESEIPAARPGLERFARSRGYALGTPDVVGSRYSPSARGPGARGPSATGLFERLFPAPVAEKEARPRSLQPVMARRSFKLLQRADKTAKSVHSVRQGDIVLLSKDAGDWLLLVVVKDEEVVFGWTTPDNIQRPAERPR